MEPLKLFYDQKGSTLTVWFGDPQDEYVCEETGEEVILIKDKGGASYWVREVAFFYPHS